MNNFLSIPTVPFQKKPLKRLQVHSPETLMRKRSGKLKGSAGVERYLCICIRGEERMVD